MKRSRSNGLVAVLGWTIAALLYVALTSQGSATPHSSPARQDAAQDDSEPYLEPEAVAVLKRSMDLIARTPRLTVTAHTGYDAVQTTGEKIEFGAKRTTSIERPNRARMKTSRRDGVIETITFDGNNLLVYHVNENVYAEAPLIGDIKAAVDFVSGELQMPTPIGDFLTAEVSTAFASNLVSGYVVGDSIIGGVTCDHIAFRSDHVDFQLWITKGDQPLPRRQVITYRDEPGQPQFWADFIAWDLSPKFGASTFTFTPPSDARRIRFAVHDPEDPAAGEE